MSPSQQRYMTWVRERTVADIAGRLAARRAQVEQLKRARNKAHDNLRELAVLRAADKLRADELQAELDEIRSMGTHRDRVDGKCQCYSCTRDFEGLFEHAAACTIDAFQQKERADRMTRVLAQVAEIAEDADSYMTRYLMTALNLAGAVDEARRWVDANPEVSDE